MLQSKVSGPLCTIMGLHQILHGLINPRRDGSVTTIENYREQCFRIKGESIGYLEENPPPNKEMKGAKKQSTGASLVDCLYQLSQKIWLLLWRSCSVLVSSFVNSEESSRHSAVCFLIVFLCHNLRHCQCWISGLGSFLTFFPQFWRLRLESFYINYICIYNYNFRNQDHYWNLRRRLLK